ncbi:MAG: hypothetical protein Q8O14_15295 [bacterium]|nr:hypothetical protein [bacterium]
MKSIIGSFAVLAILHQGWAQEIVLKATFHPQMSLTSMLTAVRQVVPTDVNCDGIDEIPILPCGFFDTITTAPYFLPFCNNNHSFAYNNIFVAKMRNPGIAEYIAIDNTYQPLKWKFIDIYSGDLLTEQIVLGDQIMIYDFDNDGLDDVLIPLDMTTFQVFGVATGNPPISPPQELYIQTVGQDYVISWSAVPTATAYRVEWSSAIDGVSFTRIGYTTETSFTHRNQADQSQGYYRVLSEDNGTGVVRMVGSTK